MEIDFAVDVPNRDAGIAFAAVVTPLGFRAEVNKNDTTGKWTCYCSRVMVPSYDAIMAIQEILAELGSPFKARPDGWGSFGNKNL
jgi:hypothetical protein